MIMLAEINPGGFVVGKGAMFVDKRNQERIECVCDREGHGLNIRKGVCC